jgi:two-component sensor histidine kinase
MPRTRPLHLVVTTVTALVIGAFTFSAWRDHQATRRETEEDLREIARLMEEHTRAALMVAAVQIGRIQDTLAPRLPRQAGSPADHQFLKRLSDELTFVDSAWIFDENANMRASSYVLPPEGLNVRDRAYYTALRDGARTFVSPLIWGRLNRQPFVVVSRRLDDTAGNFAGGVEVALNSTYFTDFYRNLNPAPGAVFAIYKNDGELVMRSVLPPQQEVFPKPVNLIASVEKNPTGIGVGTSRVDDVKRLYAYRSLDGWPLIVSAGLPLKQVFAGWRERTLRNAAITAVGLVAFWVIAALLSQTMRREAGLRARAEGLLAEKEMLFQEIHHRVKNNLQIIASFLTMQAVHARDPATAAAFEEALSRLQSMGLVHQILYEQNEATEVAMDDYLRALSVTIGQTFGAAARGITIEVAPSATRLAMDQAVPLALLANEALTNALKHAYPADRGGTIRMELGRRDDALAFSLVDDGIGMAENAKPGLGMTILSALTRQLNGELSWKVDAGTRLTVTIPA